MILFRRLRLVALAVGMTAAAACQSDSLNAPTDRAEKISFGRPTAWQPLPCWFEVHARHMVSCGQLIVSEDWTADGGRQLHLPVVIFHTASGWERAEPVVYLDGAPAAAALFGRMRT
jgi:hypothetical protein